MAKRTITAIHQLEIEINGKAKIIAPGSTAAVEEAEALRFEAEGAASINPEPVVEEKGGKGGKKNEELV